MKNLKSNLRKMATIVACLMVTTMFASCVNKIGDEENSGNDDAAGTIFTLAADWKAYASRIIAN